ncbi:DUF2195 family protein [Pseudomonas aeruginosa]
MDAKALLLGSLCLAAPFADAATLDNALSACLAARLGAPHTAEGQLHLPLTLEARRSTGECGCTSALVRYRLLARGASADKEGLLDSRQDTPRTLTLAADAGLASGRELVVTLGCQAPD